MGVRFQLVIDCAEPEPLARFWAAALGYVLEPPPEGFATWDDYYRDRASESFLGMARTASSTPWAAGRASGSRCSRTSRPSRTACTLTCTPAAGGR